MIEEINLEGDGDGYSGTFRWKKTKQLKNMPAYPNEAASSVLVGWMDFFHHRFDEDQCLHMLAAIQSDLSYIDCLSSPLSIAYMVQETVTNMADGLKQTLHIICIGCSSKAEERILMETNCWDELGYLLYDKVGSIELWLVGPEISRTSENVKSMGSRSSKFQYSANLFKGTSTDFFRSHKTLLNKSTIVVGLNCGFGNFENPEHVRFNLLFSWLPDLYFLSATKLPLFFTCANDYADLAGEVAVMSNIMGAVFAAPPARNPFSFASTMIPPNVNPSKGVDQFVTGNSFYYSMQGSFKSDRIKIDVKSKSCMRDLMGALSSPRKEIRSYPGIIIAWDLESRSTMSDAIEFPKTNNPCKDENAELHKPVPESFEYPSSLASATQETSPIHEISADLQDSQVKENIAALSIGNKSGLYYEQMIDKQPRKDTSDDAFKGVLTLLIDLPQVSNLTQVILSVSSSGDAVLLSPTQEGPPTLFDKQMISLISPIQASTIKAKFSSRKHQLKVIAKLAC